MYLLFLLGVSRQGRRESGQRALLVRRPGFFIYHHLLCLPLPFTSDPLPVPSPFPSHFTFSLGYRRDGVPVHGISYFPSFSLFFFLFLFHSMSLLKTFHYFFLQFSWSFFGSPGVKGWRLVGVGWELNLFHGLVSRNTKLLSTYLYSFVPCIYSRIRRSVVSASR